MSSKSSSLIETPQRHKYEFILRVQRVPPRRVPGGDKRGVGVERQRRGGAFRHGTGREGLLRVQIVRRARVVPGTRFSFSLSFIELFVLSFLRGDGEKRGGVRGSTARRRRRRRSTR